MNPLTADAGVRAGLGRRWSLFAILVPVVLLLALWPAARAVVEFLLPWEFWPSVLLSAAIAVLLFARGVRRAARLGVRTGAWRQGTYYGAVLVLYLAMQSQVDYYAQHMFYIHRLQHLVLHHIGPFFLILTAPQRLLLLGMPRGVRRRLFAPLRRNRIVRGVLHVVLHPVLAPILFVGGVGFWLLSSMHFDVMLSLPLYKLMNWSMIIDGLPFWWLILDRRPSPPAAMGFGGRIVALWLVMVGQIMIGAAIGLAQHDLYPVYAICGRAFALSPLVDQELGGLVVWIPGAMMSVLATIVVLSIHREVPRKAAARRR
ncbi:cytochrome c oxidase assembly protein [Solimonas terrae]|uniref:Cytochrome c oxidase assembly protein n=1 Tax=Solimonas terrae TaxID=1396819 RepID=A0A6M2BQD7_9GAMM|nr:cytochrome c oxidase assembly protein [Solimonas terrae]NGY04297.1 cytochrome c oxidase assembly protein [Solimonas terrae]